MRKFKFKIIVLLLLFSFGIAAPGSADAKTTKTSEAWASAYMKIVKNANKEDSKRGAFFILHTNMIWFILIKIRSRNLWSAKTAIG